MRRLPRLLPLSQWIEPLLALIIVGGLIRIIGHVWFLGYMPQPFFYEPADIWMDWFNTADWARDRGLYDSWGTIYPPLSFVFLRVIGISSCYIGGGGSGTAYYARDCDWLGIAALHGFYIVNIFLIARIFRKLDRRTALPRTIALSAGLPLLNSLERGNLFIVAFTCVLLAFGPILKSARLRWLAVGLAVNFKPYLIAAVFPQLLRRRWRWFEGATIAIILIYMVTYCILGAGTPFEIIDNITSFTSGQAGGLLDVWYSATYSPLLSLLNNSDFPTMSLIGSKNVELVLFGLPLIIQTIQATILLAAVAAWVRPEAVSMNRLTGLGLSLALITSESGGYSQALIVLFAFMEPWRGFGAKWAIVAGYVLCFTFDFSLDSVPPVTRDTYFWGYTAIVEYQIMIGPFIRPAIVLSIPFALACVTVRDVWVDIQMQGWKTRWRFRHDAPIMVGTGTARPPQ